MPGIRVIMNTTEGQSLSINDKEVKRIHTCKVINLTDRRDPISQAIGAVDSVDPTIRAFRYGSPHPTIAGLYCQDVYGEHFNPAWNQVKLTGTFGGLGSQPRNQMLVDVLINGVSVMKTTNYDAKGDLAWIYYDEGRKRSANPNDTGFEKLKNQMDMQRAWIERGGNLQGLLREPAEFQIPVPAPTIEFRFIKRGNAYAAWGKYEGTTNARDFQGDGPGIWMCTNVFSQTDFPRGFAGNNPLHWNAGIKFQRSPRGRGFVETRLFRNSRTGKVPADIDTPPSTTLGKGNIYPNPGQQGRQGYGMFDVLEQADWTPIGVPNIMNW